MREAASFTQLQQWMESWNLGAALEDTYTIARRLIRVHLAQPTPAQQTLIEMLLTSDAQVVKPDEPIQQQIVAVLLEMLTREDWQTIATAASQSIAERVMTEQTQAKTAIV
ncbi:hypothetical protein H6F67_25610 [Microcoleus sp. FACHB-1515]|uniref:hypothetical protein n=1 Tax=Cyanophyceae TaxID=3028117 RepID=UPI0016877174|nr:hypothetical protein [Microcoleus sp. FACHB-1515]MBD2093225.1 hypothetical protein [Microcoleus sp. FACHB-1515]